MWKKNLCENLQKTQILKHWKAIPNCGRLGLRATSLGPRYKLLSGPRLINKDVVSAEGTIFLGPHWYLSSLHGFKDGGPPCSKAGLFIKPLRRFLAFFIFTM